MLLQDSPLKSYHVQKKGRETEHRTSFDISESGLIIGGGSACLYLLAKQNQMLSVPKRGNSLRQMRLWCFFCISGQAKPLKTEESHPLDK